MSRRDTIERAAVLGALGLLPSEVYDLMALQRKIHAIGERECNGYSGYRDNAAEQAKDERAERRALKRAAEIAEAHGLKVYHQGDPRGCALYLYRPEDLLAYNVRTRAAFTGADVRDASIASCYSSIGIAVYG